MSKNKIKSLNVDLFAKNTDLFRCPLCSGKMRLVHLKSLICTNHHCFDLSKHGYVNMLSHPLLTKYDKQMFESRRIICRKGFFEPLNTKISNIIINNLESNSKTIKILDAGCGEGSLLSTIQEKITQSSETSHLGVGLDITKEGIFLASKEYTNNIWCVGDLTKAPFASRQFNCILNILSPANYAEFQRMLSHDGTIIKVIPEAGYLKELRDIFYEQNDKQVYSNGKTLELFKSKFKLLNAERVRYSVNLDYLWFKHLIHMTPLSWGTTKERLLKALEMNLSEVTIDLTILAGKLV